MSKKIMGVTVGTSISPSTIDKKIKPIKSVNNAVPDENGNLEIEIPEGANGKDGTSVTITDVTESTADGGSNVVTFSDGKTLTVKNGRKGSDGANGKDGAQGIQGEKGEQGEQGIQGIQGERGEKGEKGDKGDKGDTGDNGKDGTNGVDGKDGKDGVSVTHSWNGTTLTITSASGTSSANLKGEQGIQGVQGEKGDKGDTGAQGSKGDKGDKGDKGEQGIQGIQGADGTTQLVPLFANNTLECTDTTKLYVLPDGYIYGYIKTLPQVTYETHANSQWNGSGQLVSSNGIQAKNTNIIPVKEGDQFIYTGNGKWNASVYWLSSSALNPSASNNAIIVSKEVYGTSGAPETVTVTAPAGAKYVMFVSWEYNSPGVILEVTPLTGSYQWASTGHAFVPADYEDRIIALENKSRDSILANKKIVYDGDSIAESREGTSANNGGGYAKIIADLVGGIYVNQAVGGAYLRSTTVSGKHSVVDNLANLPTDADLYCFEGGINDYWNKATLGTFSKTDFTGTLDATTVCGALETIFRYALNTFVGKPICFVIVHKIQNTAYEKNHSSGNTFEEYRNAMVGICEKYSIPYYDAFSESGLNGWNTTQNNAYLTANADGTADGTHPNEEGYKRYYVPQLIALFEKIMPR